MISDKFIAETREHMRDGEGTVTINNWIGKDAMPPHTRLLATIVLPEGASIGKHGHDGEAEIFHVLQGEGEYDDNGTPRPVKQGSVMVCYSGESHGIKNTGKGELKFTAAIVTE